jgi:AraC-like DNA-binding protein
VKNRLPEIRKLVGAVTREQLRYVDCFVARDMGLFMPVGGACFYALTPEHTHPSYMFVLYFNDQSSIKQNGRVVQAQHGKMFMLGPGIRHQELPGDAPPRYIAVMIAKKLFEREVRAYRNASIKHIESMFFDVVPGLLPLLKRFMAEADQAFPGSKAILDALSVQICHSIMRGLLKISAPHDKLSERVEVNRVIEHLHSHIEEKLTVGSLASVACLSPSHFLRVFKQETGKSPMEYVNDLRMERVKKLLLAGDKSMTQIALDCGFGSPSYLSACFHKQYKLTPSEYQRSLRNLDAGEIRR